MSHSTKILKYDPVPQVRPAGVAPNEGPLTVKDCLDLDVHQAFQKRSLNDTIQQPEDKLPANIQAVSKVAKNLIHGVSTQSKIHAAEVLRPPILNRVLQERIDAKEKAYHRIEHMPLGRSKHNTDLFPFTNHPEFRFGDKTVESESANVLICPVPMPDPAPFKERPTLFKTLSPGERRRVYGESWTAPDIAFTPSLSANAQGEMVAEIMVWDLECQNKRTTKVESANAPAFRSKRYQELGKMQDSKKETKGYLQDNHVFGITVKPDEMNAGDLIGTSRPCNAPRKIPQEVLNGRPAGLPSRFQNQRMKGNTAKKLEQRVNSNYAPKITNDLPYGGNQNPELILPGLTLDHAFGVASVRHRPAVEYIKKFGDHTNYGDEVDAKGILYPVPGNVYTPKQLEAIQDFLSRRASLSTA